MTAEKPPRLYSDLAWLWPTWGDPAGEYASFARHVAEETYRQDDVDFPLFVGLKPESSPSGETP